MPEPPDSPEPPVPDDAPSAAGTAAATSAIRTMVDRWILLSNAVASATMDPGAAVPAVSATLGKLLGVAGLPSRDDVLALSAAVAALDARLGRMETALDARLGHMETALDARLGRIETALAGLAPHRAEARSAGSTTRSTTMADLSQITEHMNVIGADGVHVGTVDKVEGGRIKLTKDSSTHTDHHHYISGGLVAEVEGNDVRLSATGANAVTFEEEA